MDSFQTRYTYCLGQSSHLVFIFFLICIFYFFYEFSSNFHWNRYCSHIFLMGYGFLWNLVHLFSGSVFTSSSFQLQFSLQLLEKSQHPCTPIHCNSAVSSAWLLSEFPTSPTCCVMSHTYQVWPRYSPYLESQNSSLLLKKLRHKESASCSNKEDRYHIIPHCRLHDLSVLVHLNKRRRDSYKIITLCAPPGFVSPLKSRSSLMS